MRCYGTSLDLLYDWGKSVVIMGLSSVPSLLAFVAIAGFVVVQAVLKLSA
jgi:hypothetical protein